MALCVLRLTKRSGRIRSSEGSEMMAPAASRLPLSMDQSSGEMDWVPTWPLHGSADRWGRDVRRRRLDPSGEKGAPGCFGGCFLRGARGSNENLKKMRKGEKSKVSLAIVQLALVGPGKRRQVSIHRTNSQHATQMKHRKGCAVGSPTRKYRSIPIS